MTDSDIPSPIDNSGDAEIARLQAQADRPGPLAWFARNHVAANLLMVFLLVAGFMSLSATKVEVFPDTALDMIIINVPYRGATPEDVEEGVCMRVEEAISGVEGIKEIRSTALEGMGMVIAELEEYADARKVMNDIQAEVDRIATFPAETERPWYIEQSTRRQVLSLVLYGDVPERTLKELAERVRDDLTSLPNISQVDAAGARPYEIAVEVSEETLRRYGLSFDQVAAAVRQSSLDLPAGSVDTPGGEVLVRTQGQRYRGAEFEDIVVLTNPAGAELRLGQVAVVIDGFEDTDRYSRFDGQRAVHLTVYRVGRQNALDVAAAVKDYIAERSESLPAGVSLAIWSDTSAILRSRIDLLVRNAFYGLILVFASLLLFLDAKLAFWTTMGIPISFMGAFILLPYMDVSINMMSLFAFIIVLGIVVDDAIVVGENVFEYRQRGIAPIKAAIMGVREMAMPVVLAVLTTIAAFLPLMYTAGIMGKLLRSVPLVVVSVLAFSLVEALLILPAHLAHSKAARRRGLANLLPRLVGAALQRFVNGPFAWLLHRALRWRYVTLSLALVLLGLVLALYLGGTIRSVFFPSVDADNVVAYLEMPQGTPVAQTERVVDLLEAAAWRVQQEFDAQGVTDADSIFVHMATTVGEHVARGGGGPRGAGAGGGSSGAHLAEVNIQLVAGQDRRISSTAVANRWRELVGEVPGVSSLTFRATMFTPGDAVSVQLSHQNYEQLLAASAELKRVLAEYGGVSEIADSFVLGKRELKLSLTRTGRMLNITLADLARQVRQGFYGDEVQRIQRGRDDVRVMVRYSRDERRSIADIENMRFRLPDGTEVPFMTVAEVSMGRTYAAINRVDRRRVVTVTAEVDEEETNANEINDDLQRRVLPRLQSDFPGLSASFGGQQQQRAESMGSLTRNFVVALLAIFVLLALQFRSYAQPLIVMSAIPFGIVGAVLGHFVMGYDLSLMSMFGVVALTGVVVNDSLIMIDLINRRRQSDDAHVRITVVESATRRFRPIMLTTLTTFLGLTPMLLEKSLQARFLIPMAISLGFGVVFATVITLVLVPCLYLTLLDVQRGLRRVFSFLGLAEPPAVKPEPTPTAERAGA